MTTSEKIERLIEIKEEFFELLSEARELFQGTDEFDRATSYWMAHIRTALDKEHHYLGGSFITMEDSINSLKREEYEEELEEDDDE